MLADVRASNNLFGLSYFVPDAGPEESPPAGHVGCATEVVEVQPLPDGRSNIMTLGLVRYRVEEYVERGDPYLVARVEFFEDEEDDAQVVERRAGEVTEMFMRIARAMRAANPSAARSRPAVRTTPRTPLLHRRGRGRDGRRYEARLLETARLRNACAASTLCSRRPSRLRGAPPPPRTSWPRQRPRRQENRPRRITWDYVRARRVSRARCACLPLLRAAREAAAPRPCCPLRCARRSVVLARGSATYHTRPLPLPSLRATRSTRATSTCFVGATNSRSFVRRSGGDGAAERTTPRSSS